MSCITARPTTKPRKYQNIRYLAAASWSDLTDGGVVTEEDGEEDKLPDEGREGGQHPDDQHQPDLPHRSQDQQHIGKPVPGALSILVQFWGNNAHLTSDQGKKANNEMN